MPADAGVRVDRPAQNGGRQCSLTEPGMEASEREQKRAREMGLCEVGGAELPVGNALERESRHGERTALHRRGMCNRAARA